MTTALYAAFSVTLDQLIVQTQPDCTAGVPAFYSVQCEVLQRQRTACWNGKLYQVYGVPEKNK